MPAKSTPKPARKRQPRKPEFSDKFEKLLQSVAREKLNERTLETRLSQLFEAMGKYPQLAKSVGGGEADIYITDCNVIVECKASGRAGPQKPGSRRGGDVARTQQEQLFAYVRDMRKKEAESFNFEGNPKKPWIGILTDGRNWWTWEWPRTGGEPKKPHWHFDIQEEGEASAFHKIAETLFDSDRQGKPHPPEDPAKNFEGLEADLNGMYHRSKERGIGVKLKYSLWFDIIKASGMAPELEWDREELFIKHSHLVVLCKAIINSLKSDTLPNPKALLKGTHGGDFTSWILEAKGGETWIRTLTEEVDKYDWRGDTTDVLRRVYESVIPAKDRKAYGEYYTPDWLAEMLVEEILDKAWIESAVEAALEHIKKKGRGNLKGIGVLDPSCGSGTFLYHAARRILTAKALKKCSPQKQAECVARLIHGLDIHPVAVEMARATLLRALPAIPKYELSIHQGDSLLSAAATEEMLEMVEFPNAENPKFHLPKRIVVRNDFNTLAHAMVNSAIQKDETILSDILENWDKQDVKAVMDAHVKIRAICKSEGNSIWFWLIVNMVAPHRLSETKVNRILANPPWVRMSDILDVERKEVLKSMAEKLNLWIGGKQATSMDIAAIFILRCGDIYLSKEGPTSAAWLTNWAAIQGGNWQGFRKVYNNGIATQILDFSRIKKQPFHGAKSCAWIQRDGVKVRTAKHQILENKPNTKIQEKDPWRDAKTPDRGVEKRIKWDDAPPLFSREESGYCNSKGVPLFRQGATLVPYCLVSADPTTVQEQEDERIEITTLASRQRPWKKLKPRVQTGSIPQRWLIDTVRPRDALPFCLRPELSRVIVPINADGGLEETPKEEEYWEKVENIYTENKGVGKSTPQTLMAQLNFHGKLHAQLPLRGHSGRIIYNAAGKHLRASRCPPNALLSHSYYWYQPTDPEEIPYLLALLNAACLQLAFAQSRKSDRDFCTYFWQSVPLPRYDPGELDHQKLVELGRRAEGVARRYANQPRLGQVAVSKVIRKKLAADGVMGEIDAIVRKLLPRHTTPPSK